MGTLFFDPPQRLVSAKSRPEEGGFALKKKRFAVEQIVAIFLGIPIADPQARGRLAIVEIDHHAPRRGS
jgi:hypothetical protein